MKREERAAAVTGVEQLAEHLRAPARRILRQFALQMSAEGYPPDHVANDAAHLLLGIAYFGRVPENLDAVQAFPWDSNATRRHDLRGGFGEAMRLLRERQTRESSAAPA